MPSSLRRTALLLLGILATPSCRQEPAETWGFVATLGSDTTSVERITRRGDRIEGDAVGRSPAVVRRRWETTLAPDGSVRRWVMDTHIPNAPPGERDLHHEIERRGGGIRMVRRTGSDTMDRTVREPSVRLSRPSYWYVVVWPAVVLVSRCPVAEYVKLVAPYCVSRSRAS